VYPMLVIGGFLCGSGASAALPGEPNPRRPVAPDVPDAHIVAFSSDLAGAGSQRGFARLERGKPRDSPSRGPVVAALGRRPPHPVAPKVPTARLARTRLRIDRMRLNPTAIATIECDVADTLGEDARVRVFGPRLDDSRKGGDADLLFDAGRPVERATPSLLPRSLFNPCFWRPQGRCQPRPAECAGADYPLRCAGRGGAVVSAVFAPAKVPRP